MSVLTTLLRPNSFFSYGDEEAVTNFDAAAVTQPIGHIEVSELFPAELDYLLASWFKVVVTRLDKVVFTKVLDAERIPFLLRKLSLAPQCLFRE